MDKVHKMSNFNRLPGFSTWMVPQLGAIRYIWSGSIQRMPYLKSYAI